MPRQPINFSAMTPCLEQAERDGPCALPLALSGLLFEASRSVLASAEADSLALQRLTWELGANGFIMRLQKLTGLERLLPDLHLWQGGVLDAWPGARDREDTEDREGRLHPETGLQRQLSVLLCLDGEAAGDAWLLGCGSSGGAPLESPGAGRFLLFHYYSLPGCSPPGYPREAGAGLSA